MLIEVEGVAAPAVTHAFVVGVSHYPFLDGPQMTDQGGQLGLANLSSAARSASELTAWLLNEYRCPEAPLKDVRLLLSPVDGEALNADVLARMGGQPAPATRDAVEDEFTAFMKACASPADRALVFLVGHGIQLSPRSAIVLLEDFATDAEPDLLFGAIDVIGCHDAMRKFGGADHQAWFSDACRQRPEIVRRFEALDGSLQARQHRTGRGDRLTRLPVVLDARERVRRPAGPDDLHAGPALGAARRRRRRQGRDLPRLARLLEPAQPGAADAGEGAGAGRWRRPVRRPHRQAARRRRAAVPRRRRRSTSRSP